MTKEEAKDLIEEMKTVDAQIVLPSGERKKVDAFLEAGKKVDGLLGKKGD